MGNTVWTAIGDAGHITFEPASDTDSPTDATATAALVDWFDPASLPAFFRAAVPFRVGTRVHRIRNPDLWDALLPPLFRQRRNAGTAASLYRQFCVNHGTIIATTAGPTVLPPVPETVATLPDNAFSNLGIRDKRNPLHAAADAYLNRASEWHTLPPGRLFTELQTVPYVGPWTAGAVVADVTNDHSYYTMPTDVAYRHWTEFLAASSADLPEHDFAQALAALNRAHRSTLIAFTLTVAAHQRRP